MNRDTGHLDRHLVQRALELGRGTDPAALSELVQLLARSSAEVRAAAAAAIGQLAGFGLDEQAAVCALAPVALHDPQPETRQSALHALKAFGAAARNLLPDLDLLVRSENAAANVRQAARATAVSIREAVRHSEQEAVHRCARCCRPASREEHMSSRLVFDRTFCPDCFDDVFRERRDPDPEAERGAQRL